MKLKKMTVKIVCIACTKPFVKFEGISENTWAKTDLITYENIKQNYKVGDKIKIFVYSTEKNYYDFRLIKSTKKGK